jgi:hypothetical protein
MGSQPEAREKVSSLAGTASERCPDVCCDEPLTSAKERGPMRSGVRARPRPSAVRFNLDEQLC